MKKIKILFIIMTIFLILFLVPIHCQAEGVLEGLGGVGGLDNYGKLQEKSSYDGFLDKVGIFLGFIQVIGSALALICLMVLGIKYMMGSVEEKAQYKKTLLPYFIGALMVFGISNLLRVVYIIAINMF